MTNQVSGPARTAALLAQAGRSLSWAAEEMRRAATLDPMPLPDQASKLSRASELAARAADLLADAAGAAVQALDTEAADAAARASDLLHDAAVMASEARPLLQQAGSRIPMVGELLHQESAWLARAAGSLRAGKEVV